MCPLGAPFWTGSRKEPGLHLVGEVSMRYRKGFSDAPGEEWGSRGGIHWEFPEVSLTWGISGYRPSREPANTRHWLEPIHLTAKHGWFCPSTRFRKGLKKECPIPGCNSDFSELFSGLSWGRFKGEAEGMLARGVAGMGMLGPLPFPDSRSPLVFWMYQPQPGPHSNSPMRCPLLPL